MHSTETRNRNASPEILRRLSTNVKTLRTARGYTQAGLANQCGVSKKYISNVEQGRVKVTLATLETLAKGLRCDEEALLKHLPTRTG